jgi:hypothetical protein
MSTRYAHDARVQISEGQGYWVTVPGEEWPYAVLWTDMFGWTLCQGPRLEFVQLPDGGVTDAHFAINLQDPDQVIHALIGDPQ